MNSRRGFLSSLAGVTAQLVVDPEFSLWVPGARIISIPSNPAWDSYYARSRLMSNAEALAAQREAVMAELPRLMWMSSTFWNKMQASNEPMVPIRPSRIPMLPIGACARA